MYSGVRGYGVTVNVENKPFHQIIFRSSGRRGKSGNNVIPFFRATISGLPAGLCFVATSDLQGRENGPANRLAGEVVADELALLQRRGEIPSLDFVALAGDFYDFPDLRKLGGTGDITPVWNAFANNFPRIVGVHGNHDLLNGTLANQCKVLDGDVIEVSKVRIGGVCGIIGTSNRNQRTSREAFLSKLTSVIRGHPALILLHQGPEGTNPGQRGDPSISGLIQSAKVTTLFGHTHWDEPLCAIGRGHVVNVDRRVIVFQAIGL